MWIIYWGLMGEVIAELACMGKKTWLPMHQRNFGSELG